jgi:glycosyltransferase involved in cell wall biosynthesis
MHNFLTLFHKIYQKCYRYYKKNGLSALFKAVYFELRFAINFSKVVISNFTSAKESILVVTHDVTRTGAPILAFNIANKFTSKYNVFILALGGGALSGDFERLDVSHIRIINSRIFSVRTAINHIKKLIKEVNFKFAVVNSIESRSMLHSLHKYNVPTITLLHEFISSIEIEDAFLDAYLQSNEIVFSAEVVRTDFLDQYSGLNENKIHLIPQGKCDIPDEIDHSQGLLELQKFKELIRPGHISPDTKVILGAGYVHFRKGVDLFLDCAAKILSGSEGHKYRFVWVGGGYDPEKDMAYSRLLRDQILRSGIDKQVLFIEESPHINVAYENADLFLLTSRLDPLPNVAIDAMFHKLPVLCFDKTTGIADFLKESGMGDSCVASYLDVDGMVNRILFLGKNHKIANNIGEHLYQQSKSTFDMNDYIHKLDRLGEGAFNRKLAIQNDIELIADSGLTNYSYFFGYPIPKIYFKDMIASQMNSWRNGVSCRKPFPGFHPGIYAEEHGVRAPSLDPFADFIHNGMPIGPWIYPVINCDKAVIAENIPANDSVALHLHVFYPELLPEIMLRLGFNRIKPDLFISVPSKKIQEQVLGLIKGYQGAIVCVEVVPNRGRDIGPLLTLFGERILNNYAYIGHLHTKKTKDLKDRQLIGRWREFLLVNLLGKDSFGMADAILSHLNTDSNIGIVFPDDPNAIGWDKNKNYAIDLARQLGIKNLPENFIFPVGTMFWAKTKALENMINRKFKWEDYPEEPLPYDGSMLHALERLLGFPSNGYRAAASWIEGSSR